MLKDLRKQLDEKKISAKELTDSYYDQIGKLNDTVKSYLTLCPELAEQQAEIERLEAERIAAEEEARRQAEAEAAAAGVSFHASGVSAHVHGNLDTALHRRTCRLLQLLWLRNLSCLERNDHLRNHDDVPVAVRNPYRKPEPAGFHDTVGNLTYDLGGEADGHSRYAVGGLL